MEHAAENERGDTWVPGTVPLADEPTNTVTRASDQLVLIPTPTADPNDPLNWSSARKGVNFTIACFFVFFTFVELVSPQPGWNQIREQLHLSVEVLNAGVALNYGGLAIGCVFFIPLAHKFGRRPLYILSAMLQTASCIWGARIQTAGDQIGSGFVTGIGSSISETIVQMTVADIFFVHQHGTMNAWYGFFQSIGAFLGPVAAGYITNSQGWRWTWWWCVIFIGTTLVIVTVFLEESKYVPIQDCHGPSTPKAIHDPKESTTTKTEIELAPGQPAAQIRPKSYLQRMKLITKTDEPILVHFYQPLVSLVTFPAVAYCAITYGFTFCWFAIMNSLLATYIFGPPWHFTANTVGLFHIPPFIGGTIGYVYGGYLCDRWIMRLSKRNNGIYEPEMRLWLALPIAIIYPAGILMFGLGLAYGKPWPLLAVGFGVCGLGLGSLNAIALSYLMDCYQEIIGDALIGVIFIRNILSLIVLFVLTPWVQGMGIADTHILCAVIAFAIYLLPTPLLVWGKRMRKRTAASYKTMVKRQLVHRASGY